VLLRSKRRNLRKKQKKASSEGQQNDGTAGYRTTSITKRKKIDIGEDE
jgi:hypothetical protein